MTQLEGDQFDQLLEAVAARLPATWPQRGGGWPYEIEAALIDAVLSIRNRYGKSPTSGVRGSVTRYRNKRAMPADDREHLERQDPVPLASVLGIPFDPGERPCPGDWSRREPDGWCSGLGDGQPEEHADDEARSTGAHGCPCSGVRGGGGRCLTCLGGRLGGLGAGLGGDLYCLGCFQ